MTEPLITRVVRKRGAEKTHVVDVPRSLFGRYRSLGAEFTGIALPVATRCGVELRGASDVAVCMLAGTRVRCVQCRRIAGIELAAEGNETMPDPPNMLFEPGQISATQGAVDTMGALGVDPRRLIARHLTGDWGELDPEDAAANQAALRDGERILSAYGSGDSKLYVITEANRTVTTILRPDEY